MAPALKMRAVVALAAALVAGPALAGPASSPAPLHTYSRVISMAPHITELIFAAGGGDRIVATVNSSDYPPVARRIPRIGDGMNVDTERVVALRPDLVAAWLPGGAARTLSPALTALHIPLIYSQPRKLDDIPHEILRFGRLLGTEHVAQTAAEQLGARIDALRKRYADRSPVRVFIEIGSEPLYTIGNDPLLNDVLKVCGGVNPYAGSRAAAPQVSTENVLVLQPDALVVSATDPARVQARTQAWAELRLDAALHGKVYGLDPDELYRPGPRLVDAAEQLCADLDEARQPALER